MHGIDEVEDMGRGLTGKVISEPPQNSEMLAENVTVTPRYVSCDTGRISSEKERLMRDYVDDSVYSDGLSE